MSDHAALVAEQQHRIEATRKAKQAASVVVRDVRHAASLSARDVNEARSALGAAMVAVQRGTGTLDVVEAAEAQLDSLDREARRWELAREYLSDEGNS